MTLIKNILGYSFIFLGIIGLFLPLLQGIAFILIGLAILNPNKIKKAAVNVYHVIKKPKKHISAHGVNPGK